MTARQEQFKLHTFYTPQEFYYLKQGVYQCQRFNKFIVKCRKERHFVDFGKKKKEEMEEGEGAKKVSSVFTMQPAYQRSLEKFPIS